MDYGLAAKSFDLLWALLGHKVYAVGLRPNQRNVHGLKVWLSGKAATQTANLTSPKQWSCGNACGCGGQARQLDTARFFFWRQTGALELMFQCGSSFESMDQPAQSKFERSSERSQISYGPIRGIMPKLLDAQPVHFRLPPKGKLSVYRTVFLSVPL